MVTIAEFNTAFSKNIRKHFDLQSREAIEKTAVNKIFRVGYSDEYTHSVTTTEGIDLPTWLSESETLPTSSLGKGYKSTFDSAEFGHNIIVTYKDRVKMKDNSEKIAEYVNSEKNGQIIAMSSFVEIKAHALLDDAFSGSTYTAPDSLPLCSDAHEWNSSDATFDNKLAASAPSTSVIDTVLQTGGAFTDSEGTSMPQRYDTIICKTGGSAARAFKRILGYNNADAQLAITSVGSLNVYVGEFTLIETPWLTSGTAYFFVNTDMKANPLFLDFVDTPKLQGDMIQEKNLDWVYSYAGSFKYGIDNMPYGILGSPGA